MIENWGLTFVATCDGCGETVDTDCDQEDGFKAAVNYVKKAGWLIYRPAGDWVHECPCCQGSPEDDFDDL